MKYWIEEYGTKEDAINKTNCSFRTPIYSSYEELWGAEERYFGGIELLKSVEDIENYYGRWESPSSHLSFILLRTKED